MSDTAFALQAGFAVALGAYLLGCGLGTLHRLIEERRAEKLVRDIKADIERCDAAVVALIKFREAQSGRPSEIAEACDAAIVAAINYRDALSRPTPEGEYHAC